ncbi:MAG: Kae1-associated kinase Bud32 [Desulfurococcaceae archaeon]
MAEIIGVGAEAILYKAWLGRLPVVVKVRISKSYRDPRYDELFRRARTRTEARILAQLRLAGLKVPAPFLVDLTACVIVMEYLEGRRLSEELAAPRNAEELRRAMRDLGAQVAKMHSMGIYHGDLTATNVIVREPGGEPYIIDFGLAGYSWDVEEHAIDVHLFTRSLEVSATGAEALVREFRAGYEEVSEDNARAVWERVDELRRRGRYISREVRRALARERYRA